MRDIFNILKHEGHDVRTIKHNGELLLGCKTCGTTLYSLDQDMDIDINDILSVYETIMKEGLGSLSISIKEFIQQLILGIDYNSIAKKINENAKNKLESYIKYDYNTDCAYYETTVTTLLINYLREKQSKLFTRTINSLIDIAGPSIMNEINENIRKQIKLTINQKDFKLLEPDEIVTYSYSTFNNKPMSTDTIFIIFKGELEKAQKEKPTPTDVIKVKNISDIMPNYEDEEDTNEKFLEYKYRIQNDLYDFSDIKDSHIMHELEDFIDSWDYCERYSYIANVLTNRIKNREKNKKQEHVTITASKTSNNRKRKRRNVTMRW